MTSQVHVFPGPSLIVGVPVRPSATRILGIQKSVRGQPAAFLRATVNDIGRFREEGVSSLFLEVDGGIFSAEKVFRRYLDLGFDVFLSKYNLLRPGVELDETAEELRILFNCAWSFLPFLLAAPEVKGLSEGIQTCVELMEPLRELSHWEFRVLHSCWQRGVWHWSSALGVSGVRSALRIIETENAHVLRLGLTRARHGFRFGREVFQVGVSRLLDRRPEQLRAVERMLSRV